MGPASSDEAQEPARVMITRGHEPAGSRNVGMLSVDANAVEIRCRRLSQNDLRGTKDARAAVAHRYRES